MNRYGDMMRRLTDWGEKSDCVRAILIIGSQARKDRTADEYSDLDAVLISDNPTALSSSDEWLRLLGSVRISFTECTVGGATERRVLFDDGLDADFVLLPQDSLSSPAASAYVDILRRGYRILVDKTGLSDSLPAFSDAQKKRAPDSRNREPVGRTAAGRADGQSAPVRNAPPVSEADFVNLTHDFWYHSVWTAKKLLRGELWTALDCLDGYMKRLLLSAAESEARGRLGEAAVWHNGRFLEEWADAELVQALPRCFARYDPDDIKSALLATTEAFRRLATTVAARHGFSYPAEADSFATKWVTERLCASSERNRSCGA